MHKQKKSQSLMHPVLFAGPSGVGKGTLIAMLLKKYPTKFSLIPSHTTRSARPGEVDGIHYCFVTKEQFISLKDINGFVETNEYNENYYGTSKEQLDKCQKSGKTPIIEIDINGCKQVKNSGIITRCIALIPPGEDPSKTLENRLRERGTETEESILRRLERGKEELNFFRENPTFYDIMIVNDDKDVAFEDLEKFLIKDINN